MVEVKIRSDQFISDQIDDKEKESVPQSLNFRRIQAKIGLTHKVLLSRHPLVVVLRPCLRLLRFVFSAAGAVKERRANLSKSIN